MACNRVHQFNGLVPFPGEYQSSNKTSLSKGASVTGVVYTIHYDTLNLALLFRHYIYTIIVIVIKVMFHFFPTKHVMLF